MELTPDMVEPVYTRIGSDATRPQPTASMDAEQVWQEAWDAYHGEPWPRSISESEQAIAVIRTAMEAYGDARADAARREALEEAATAYEAETHTWTEWPAAGAARRKGAKAIRALKGSQQ